MKNEKINTDKMSNKYGRIPDELPMVSLFDNYYKKNPSDTICLWEWLKHNKYKEEVMKYRKTKNRKKCEQIKSQLPCITPSGIFLRRRKNELIQHSGYICIDIDYKQNEVFGRDWFEVKRKVADAFDSLCYAGMSISGNGIFLLFKIAYPERHQEQFNALAYEIKEKIGLTVDKSGCDVTRLRGASYDEYPIFNLDAIAYKRVRRSPRQKSVCRTVKAQDATDAKVNALIEKIGHDRIDITSDYKDWFAIGCALASEYGKIEGLRLFHLVSMWSPKYYETECDEQFHKCLKYGTQIKIATFFYICRKYGVMFK